MTPVEFSFESHLVRVVADEGGAPLFVAADVLGTLGLDRKALERLDADEKGVSSVHTLGGDQEMVVVNEPGLFSLVLGSRKAEAKRFKRWVTHEVLPAIRRTGAYVAREAVPVLPAPTQDRVTSILRIGEAVAKVPGVKFGIAMAATLTCIQENTGLSLESLRRSLPAAESPPATMNPTQLGKLLGISARAVNARLEALGLQIRNDRDEWELSDTGQAWAEALPFSRHGHSGYQILWNPAVVERLREAA